MRIIKLAAEGIAGLLGLAVLIITFNALFSSNVPDRADLGSAPGLAPTLAPPIDVSKLHVAKITQVDFQGCSVAVSIAPDNEHYVCSKGGVGTGLWLGSFSKGLERKLADDGDPLGWLPNGRQIVYAEIIPHQPTMLYELDIESGARIPISTTTMPFGGAHFQILRDGQALFLERGMLQAWDSRTRTSKPLQTLGCIDSQMTPTAKVFSFYTTLSPDGQHLADQCAGRLYLKDISAGNVITLTNEVGNAIGPMAWSPDARTLAFSFRPEYTHNPELWLVNADGTNPRRLWRGELARAFEFLTWMPDGQTLLFINDPGGTSFEGGSLTYMAISVKGGAPKVLFANGESLALFDNGRKILILRSGMMSNLPRGNFIVELSQ